MASRQHNAALRRHRAGAAPQQPGSRSKKMPPGQPHRRAQQADRPAWDHPLASEKGPSFEGAPLGLPQPAQPTSHLQQQQHGVGSGSHAGLLGSGLQGLWNLGSSRFQRGSRPEVQGLVPEQELGEDGAAESHMEEARSGEDLGRSLDEDAGAADWASTGGVLAVMAFMHLSICHGLLRPMLIVLNNADGILPWHSHSRNSGHSKTDLQRLSCTPKLEGDSYSTFRSS